VRSLNIQGFSVPAEPVEARKSSFSQPARQWEELKAIAAPVAGTGKAAPERVQQVILRLCAGRYLTSEQLGDLLDRNPAGLRNRFLTPMVTAGLLRLRYPATVSRPDQATPRSMNHETPVPRQSTVPARCLGRTYWGPVNCPELLSSGMELLTFGPRTTNCTGSLF